MHPEVLARLRCPVCHGALDAPDPVRDALRCARGHSFDQAKQGYVQLTAKPLVHTGDTPEMVAARAEFLGAGHYDPISDAVADVARQMPADGLLVDAGAGDGHHAARVLAAAPHAYGLALDASKACARRAARAHPRMDALVCDVWQPLPLADGAADLVMNVFAPRAGAEFARVLAAAGALVTVTPQPEHLRELIGPLRLLRVDRAKPERVANELGDRFTRASDAELTWSMSLHRGEVAALVGMGPSAWHVDPQALAAAIDALSDPAHVTAAVRIGVYRLDQDLLK